MKKKIIKKKKVAKKVKAKAKPRPFRPFRPSAEIVVRVEQPAVVTPKDLEPEKEGGKYMIPKTWLSERQVIRMVASKTPPEHIYTRPGKGGGTFTYVTGTYITKVLNFVFGFNWDFKIISHGKEGNQVWVLGELTVKDDKGHAITKSQFGRADIKMMKAGGMVDFGNDLKAATTDALKKCASLLGIASDVYGKAEFKQEANVDVVSPALQAPKVATPTATIVRPLKPEMKNDTAYRCKECAKEVTEAEAEYSQSRFGKILCREHQPNKK